MEATAGFKVMDEVRVDGLRAHTSDAGLSEEVKNSLQNIYGG